MRTDHAGPARSTPATIAAPAAASISRGSSPPVVTAKMVPCGSGPCRCSSGSCTTATASTPPIPAARRSRSTPLLRDGDADGPLLVTVADYKRMVGFPPRPPTCPALRDAGRLTTVDRVEYLTFPIWQPVD